MHGTTGPSPGEPEEEEAAPLSWSRALNTPTQLDATVIVPTFNRCFALLATLSRLESVDHPRDRWEVIVVDDGSTDDTEVEVGRWVERATIRVRYERQDNTGPAAARNRGAHLASGRVLVFIDNDILVRPDFLRLHLAALSGAPNCWVIGRIVHPAAIRETPFGRFRDELWERFHETQGGRVVAETDGMTAANLSLPAADFHRLGGFDEAFTIASSEDWELGYRARQAGVRVLYHPGIVVVHDDWAVSLAKFCERQRLYALSDVLLWRKYGERSPRLAVVLENGPIDWGRDRPSLIVKKGLKRLLASRPGSALLRAGCTLAELLMPARPLTARVYEAAVSVAIFRGVREGMERYRAIAPLPEAKAVGPALPEQPSSV